MTINNSGDTLIDRINESSTSIFDSVESRLDNITDRLSTSGEAFASLLHFQPAQGHMPAKLKVDWESIACEYRAGQLSIREIGHRRTALGSGHEDFSDFLTCRFVVGTKLGAAEAIR